MTAPNMDAPGAVASGDRAQGEESTGIVREKRLSSLRAQLAIHGGHVVHELHDASFLVCWRGYSKALPDLQALANFARQVGAV